MGSEVGKIRDKIKINFVQIHIWKAVKKPGRGRRLILCSTGYHMGGTRGPEVRKVKDKIKINYYQGVTVTLKNTS